MLDSSQSIGSDGFEELKRFSKDLVAHYTVSPSDTRVGMVVYNTEVLCV